MDIAHITTIIRDIVYAECESLRDRIRNDVRDTLINESVRLTPRPVRNTASPLIQPPVHGSGSLLGYLSSFSKGALTRFRSDIQQQALEAVRRRQNHTLVVLPTGGGKSLLWMLPAATFFCDLVTIIIVPFTALRHDIKRHCADIGLPCAEWSQQSPDAPLVLVPLEMVADSSFQTFARIRAREGRLAQIVIEEVHLTITTQGYRKDLEFLNELFIFNVPVLLLSATVPPHAVDTVKSFLGITRLDVLRAPTSITNLRIEVHVLGDTEECLAATYDRVLSLLPMLEDTNGRGIIICCTKTDAAAVATKLGLEAYHGQLDGAAQARLHGMWVDGHQKVMPARTAFGSGLDFAHVRFVIHYQLSYSMWDYIQEIGRAGRDGLTAYAIMYVDRSLQPTAPDPDLQGVNVLTDMVFREKNCRRLPISTHNDGVPVNCLAMSELCDLCTAHSTAKDARHVIYISIYFTDKSLGRNTKQTCWMTTMCPLGSSVHGVSIFSRWDGW